jgi:hypothetical protein
LVYSDRYPSEPLLSEERFFCIGQEPQLYLSHPGLSKDFVQTRPPVYKSPLEGYLQGLDQCAQSGYDAAAVDGMKKMRVTVIRG